MGHRVVLSCDAVMNLPHIVLCMLESGMGFAASQIPSTSLQQPVLRGSC